MLRLCDVNTFYSPRGGGVRQYLHRKIEFYRQRTDVRYSVVVLGERHSVRQVGAARWYTIRGFPVPGAPHYRWMAGIGELTTILHQENPHLIEVGAPYLSPLLVRLAARKLGSKLVGFWHADYPDTYVAPALAPLGTYAAELGRQAAWAYARATIGRFDAVMAASQFLVSKLEEHGMRRVYLTPLGVDTDLFHPQRRNGLSRSGREGGNFRTILYVGRLGPEKGVRTLLDAYPGLASQHPELRLVMMGDGPLRGLVESLRQACPSVQVLGYGCSREKQADLLARAAVAITPGGYETFSLSTLEALSSGTPVVCADTGGAAELVCRSGAGVLFRAGDAADLSRAIETVLGWNREEYDAASRRGRDFALVNHPWDTVLAHQLDCYREVIGQERQKG